MSRRFLIAFAVVSTLLPLYTARAEIQVGAAMRVITPDPLLPVSGGMGTEAGQGEAGRAHGPGGRLSQGGCLGRRRRARSARVSLGAGRSRPREGEPHPGGEHPDRLDAHAQCAGLLRLSRRQGGHTGDLKYMDFVCDKAAEAVNEAIDRLQPAWIKIATGEAKGKIAYNYYAPDLYDRRMSVIQAVSPEARRSPRSSTTPSIPKCSATTSAFSAPTWSARSARRSKPQAGGMAMFVNGAQGGMITADNRELDQPRDPLAATGTTRGPGKNACGSAT